MSFYGRIIKVFARFGIKSSNSMSDIFVCYVVRWGTSVFYVTLLEIGMFNFKELFALVGLLFIIGIVGILYRTVIERPVNLTQNGQVICSQDTRTCADGTIQKRTEPACTFAICPQDLPVATTTATTTVIDSATTSVKKSTHNVGGVPSPR